MKKSSALFKLLKNAKSIRFQLSGKKSCLLSANKPDGNFEDWRMKEEFGKNSRYCCQMTVGQIRNFSFWNGICSVMMEGNIKNMQIISG